MQSLPLKYVSSCVVMQEVPDEISLAINISGCPHKCEGCHSNYLETYDGEYLSENIDKLIEEYSDLISCVCLMGGDQNMSELKDLLVHIKKIGLKTCVYSGADNLDLFSDCFEYLDWLKLGSYKKELATDSNIQYGVKLATSNQSMCKKGIDY